MSRIEHRLKQLKGDKSIYQQKTITIKDYQVEFLKKNPEINLSGLVQKMIDNFMIKYNYQKQILNDSFTEEDFKR